MGALKTKKERNVAFAKVGAAALKKKLGKEGYSAHMRKLAQKGWRKRRAAARAG